MINCKKITIHFLIFLFAGNAFASSIVIDFALPTNNLPYKIPQTIAPNTKIEIDDQGVDNFNAEIAPGQPNELDQLFESNDIYFDIIDVDPVLKDSATKKENKTYNLSIQKKQEQLDDINTFFLNHEKFDIVSYASTFFAPQSKLISLVSPSPVVPISAFSFLGPVYKNTFKVPEIPIYTNKKINGLIHLYTKRKSKVLKRAIVRSSKYLGTMKEIFREYRLPENLVYLSIVESNLNPKARSRANALGIWQFMSYTGRAFNLNQSWWHEDRYDPIKSTHAAARYLTSLHRQFNGDWELALAAYNSGGGRVRKAQRKARRQKKSPIYWNLDLPRETRGYVPAFYAVANLFSDLNKYGFDEVQPYEKAQLTRPLSVPGGISLTELAGILKIKYLDFKNFNPGLIKGMTPATLTAYNINIPSNTIIESHQLKKIESLKKFRQKFWKHHKVKKGDSLWAISRKYGIPISKIKAFNQFRRKNLLRIGQKIMLPVPSEWKNSRVAKTRTSFFKKAKAKLDKIPGVTYIHKVEKGDTLWNISQRFKVSIRSLKSWNRGNLRTRILKIGTKLLIKIPINLAKSVSAI